MFLLKLYPLAFLFAQGELVHGMSERRKFLCQRDEDEVELPVQVFKYDASPVWPATTTDKNIIMMGGNTFGLVGTRG